MIRRGKDPLPVAPPPLFRFPDYGKDELRPETNAATSLSGGRGGGRRCVIADKRKNSPHPIG
jgi:hypothetical protein